MMVEFLGFCFEGGVKRAQGGEQMVARCVQGRDVHGGGNDVVAGLPHVDVIVGVDRRLGTRQLRSIWMARLAMTSLVFMLVEVPEPVWKMSMANNLRIELAVDDFLGGPDDWFGQVFLKEP